MDNYSVSDKIIISSLWFNNQGYNVFILTKYTNYYLNKIVPVGMKIAFNLSSIKTRFIEPVNVNIECLKNKIYGNQDLIIITDCHNNLTENELRQIRNIGIIKQIFSYNEILKNFDLIIKEVEYANL